MTSNRFKSSLILGAALVVVVAAPVAAQAPMGTRAAGLAGAFVAVADDASGVYWNPAGLATGAIFSFLATFAEQDIGRPEGQAIQVEQLAGRMVALSFPPIGIAYYRLGAFGTERAASAVTGLPSREEVRRGVQALTTDTVGVSLLQSLTEYMVVGATPKLMRGADRTTLDVDAGLMVAVERMRFGMVARNLTTPTFGEIELSREVRVGGAWGSGWPGHSRVMASIDCDLTLRPMPFGGRRDLAAGVETWWRDRRLGLRGGVRRSTIGDMRAAVTGGVTYAVRPSVMVEGHVAAGQRDERGWSVGIRAGF